MSPCIKLSGGGHLCLGGPEYIMDTSKGRVRFEMHRYLGPMPCDRFGYGRVIPDRHPFWEKVNRWCAGGMKVDGQHCVIPPPPPPCPDCSGRGHTGTKIRIGRRTGYQACQTCKGTGAGAEAGEKEEERT